MDSLKTQNLGYGIPNQTLRPSLGYITQGKPIRPHSGQLLSRWTFDSYLIYFLETRFTLGFAILTGFVTVISSLMRIKFTQKETMMRISSLTTLINTNGLPSRRSSFPPPATGSGHRNARISCDAGCGQEPYVTRTWTSKHRIMMTLPLKPYFFTSLCLTFTIILLGVVSLATSSDHHNGYVLGLSMGTLSLTILLTEIISWCMTWKWIRDYLWTAI